MNNIEKRWEAYDQKVRQMAIEQRLIHVGRQATAWQMKLLRKWASLEEGPLLDGEGRDVDAAAEMLDRLLRDDTIWPRSRRKRKQKLPAAVKASAFTWICDWCGKDMEVQRSTRQTCSQKCRNARKYAKRKADVE